jgi:hypothetical protein
MSCIRKIDKEKYARSGYASFRIRDPELFTKEMKRPRWARIVAYVVQGKLKTGEWAVQSIRIFIGNRTDEQLFKYAREIAEKLCACEDTVNERRACQRRNYTRRKK